MSPVHGKGRSARTLGQKDPRTRRTMNRWDRPDLILGDGMEIDTSSKMGVALSATPGLEFSSGMLKVKVKASSGVLIGADGLYGDTTVLASLTSLNDHSARHENGGADEISVAGLSGLLADGQTPLAHASSHNAGGSDAMAIDAVAATGSLRTLGTSSTSACAGNDSRLSDARTPTTHATSHQSGGSDAIKLDDLAAPDDNTDLNVSTSKHGLAPKAPNSTIQWLRGDASFATVPGRLVAFTVYVTGSGNHTWNTATTAAIIQITGGGGGGGGVSGAAAQSAAAGGGGAGGTCIKYLTGLTGGNTMAYAVGAGGAGGTAGANNGTDGTGSSMAATYTGGPGTGGTAMATGTALGIAAGGAGGSPTNGDINISGGTGLSGFRVSGSGGMSGMGGTSFYGGGAVAVANAAGTAAACYGAGGTGAATIGNTNRAGGDGKTGCILIWEFA